MSVRNEMRNLWEHRNIVGTHSVMTVDCSVSNSCTSQVHNQSCTLKVTARVGGCKAGGTSITCTQILKTKWISTLALIIATKTISEHNCN